MSDTESLSESPAIETLGSLFKVTEIYLWDSAKVSVLEDLDRLDDLMEESVISSTMTDSKSSINNKIADYYTSMEDFGLAEQMDALGLPLSFGTTKQTKNSFSIKRKPKVTQAAAVSANKDIENRVPGSSRNCLAEENLSSRVLHDSTNILLHDKNTESSDEATYFYDDRESSSVVAAVVDEIAEKQIGDDVTDVNMSNCVENNCVEGISISNCINGENDDIKDLNYCSTSMFCEFGDWRVIWDSFYERNYFYNIQSKESTWHSPQGLESFALCYNTYSSDVAFGTAEEHTDIDCACDAIQDIDLHVSHEKEGSQYLIKSAAEAISYAHSDEHEREKKTADIHDSLNKPTANSIDKPDVIELWDKQERHVTSSEACSVPDVLPDVLPELLTSNSLTTTVNEREMCKDSENSPDTGVTSLIDVDDLDNSYEIVSKKKKKKKKRVRRVQSQLSLQEVDGGLPTNIVKYWCQRYLLFSQFDNGIMMDEEGWFSVTPESIARHHATRCGNGIIIDCFTGVGGNAIQFAMMSNHVIAVDIDPQKIDYAQQNAAIYGVSDRINFIKGDFFQIAPHLKADSIFMSPPWGGPDYNKVQTYDINSMLKPHDGQYLFEIVRTIASKVVMFLPRNADLNQLAEISLSVNPPWALEVEKNFLNGRLKAITAYFSNPML